MSDPTDEELQAELGEAIRAAAQVPEHFLAAGRTAFAWRTADDELAAMVHDSAAGVVASGTRADPAAVRSLTFVGRELSIEIDLTDDALRGQVVPPQRGEIELRRPDGSARTAPVDDVGWFTIPAIPGTMFRLHLRTAAGATVVTEWVMPTPPSPAG